MTSDERHPFQPSGLALVLAIVSATAQAGGIDRSGQDIGVLFETGDRVEFSHARIAPRVKGVDLAGGATGDVAGDHSLTSLSVKFDLDERWSLAALAEQPYGADIRYAGSSALLGGTEVDVVTSALLGLVRLHLTPAMSVHAGLRTQRASASVTLSGLAYGPVDGYRVRLGPDRESGWVAGAAYERADIALRVALTCHSAIEHSLRTQESGPALDPDGPGPSAAMDLLDGTSLTRISTPRALNLDFRTGIASDTLLYGQVRWADWSAFRVEPARFLAVTGEGLIELDDVRTYSLGLAHRFNERWSGFLSVNHEARGASLVSPLAPVNGRLGIGLGVQYTRGALSVGAGVSYVRLGDAVLETGTPDTARATMQGNATRAAGLRLSLVF